MMLTLTSDAVDRLFLSVQLARCFQKLDDAYAPTSGSPCL
jgi:hypothetical protein